MRRPTVEIRDHPRRKDSSLAVAFALSALGKTKLISADRGDNSYSLGECSFGDPAVASSKYPSEREAQGELQHPGQSIGADFLQGSEIPWT
jgi:hypothetical protein